MEIIHPGTTVDFVGKKNTALMCSLVVILASVVSLIAHGGPRLGVDFAGGTNVTVKFQQSVTAEQIRQALAEVNLKQSTIQQFEEAEQHEFIIQVEQKEGESEHADSVITDALRNRFGEESFEVVMVEMVGPKVGKDLRRKGFLSILYAVFFMLIYIWLRFELRFGVGAVIALIHDVLITVGVFSITNREITLPIVAAFLTIVGYSINDTIVVYDRIRENRRKKPNNPLAPTINQSINETLSRTILTSGTTLLVVIALFIFGGGIIHDFAFALLVGIIVGTYSSIFIASPVLLFWEQLFAKKKKA